MVQHDHMIDNLLHDLQDEQAAVRASAIDQLAQLRAPRTIDALVWLMGDSSLWVRCNAAEALGEFRSPDVVEPLVAFLRRGARTELEIAGPPESDPVRFHRFARQPDPVYADWLLSQGVESQQTGFSLAVSARIGLQKVGLVATDVLIDLLEDANPYTRYVAVGLLNIMSMRRQTQVALLDALQHGPATTRQGAALAMGRLGNFTAVSPLAAALEDESQKVVQCALLALTHIRDKRAIPALQALAKRDDAWKTKVETALLEMNSTISGDV